LQVISKPVAEEPSAKFSPKPPTAETTPFAAVAAPSPATPLSGGEHKIEKAKMVDVLRELHMGTAFLKHGKMGFPHFREPPPLSMSVWRRSSIL